MFEVHEQNDLIAAGIAKKIRLTNISKTEIKEKCNISINTINNCLKGNNVNLRSVLAIMAALGMNLKEFVEFAEKNLKEFPKIGDAPRSVDIETVSKVKEKTTEAQVKMRLGIKKEDDVEEIFNGIL